MNPNTPQTDTLHTDTLQEASRAIPVAGDYDVVVCGGGTSGFPAAVAAARQGARVALLERYGFLGGVPAYSIMPTWHGLDKHHSGLLSEFAARVKAFGQGPDPLEDHNNIEPETVKQLFLEMALEAGVELHLHTFVAGARKEGAELRAVVTESKSGRRAFRARTFVDATGDGDLAYHAGASYMKGRGGQLQGMTLRFRIGHIDFPRYFDWVADNPHYYRNITTEQLDFYRDRADKGQAFMMHGNLSDLFKQHHDIPELPPHSYFNCASLRPNELSVNATRVYGVDGTVEEDLTRAEVLTRKQAYAIWRFLRAHVPGFARSMIVDIPTQIGVRETRCTVGDYVLTEQDCRTNREFADSVMTTRLAFDIHDVDEYVIETVKGVVDVPYRCFLAKDIEGLLVVGRNLSCDHVTNSTIRKMETAFQSGQVGGTAAALAALQRVTPRASSVGGLQRTLLEQGFMTSQEERYRRSEVVVGRQRGERAGQVRSKRVDRHTP